MEAIEMIKLSIIVPVYNVEPYLRKCIDSVLAQDYADYEIILVDDGSTDGSGEICDEYSQLKIEDRRLKISVIHQENGGLSAARNAGIKASKGQYVCFLDSDDYWLPNKLGALLKQIEEEQLDVLRFDHQNVRISAEGQYEVFQPYKNPHHVDRNHKVVDGLTYLDERMGYDCYACQFVINRELACQFSPDIHFEDTEWLPRMMLQAKRVNSTETVVYSYLHRPGSITQTQGNMDKKRRNVEDMISVIEKYNVYKKQNPNSQWLWNMQSSMVAGVLTSIARDFYDERKLCISRLREMNVFPLSIANQGKTYTRRARIINLIGANAYCAIMKLR